MAGSNSVFTGRSEFHDTLRSAFDAAADAGAAEIILCDCDFADWPLGERSVVESLTRWAKSPRRLILVAQHFDAIVQRHARWVAWRRQWSHLVQCRTNDELEGAQMPTLLLVPGVICVQLIDPVHHRGIATAEARAAVRGRELIDAVLQRSIEAFPATTAGL